MNVSVVKVLALCIGIIAGLQVTASDSLAVVQGEELFVQNCKACHQLDQRMVGPALNGVQDRRSDEWIHNFIKSSQSMIAAGDSAAVALFNTYNQVMMPDQNLTDEEINSILAYIGSGGVQIARSGTIPRPEPTTAVSTMKPPRFSDYRFWILYTVTVLLVIVSIYYKAELIALRKRVLPEAD